MSDESQPFSENATTAEMGRSSTEQQPASESRFPLPYRRWRRGLSRAFAIIGTITLLLSVTAGWVRSTVLSTDEYLAAVSDLPSQPGISHIIAVNITDAVVEQGVPLFQEQIKDPSLRALVPFAAEGLRPQIEQAVQRGVRSPQFKTVWVMANKQTHALLIKVLQGETIAGVETGGAEIVVNIGNVASTLLPTLGNSSFGKTLVKIAKNGEIRIPMPKEILQARAQLRMANQYYALLVLVTLLLLVAAVVISDRPRRMAQRMGWWIAGSALAFIVAIRVAIATSAGSIIDSDMSAAAREVADALTAGLVQSSITVMLVAALAAGAATWVGRKYPQLP